MTEPTEHSPEEKAKQGLAASRPLLGSQPNTGAVEITWCPQCDTRNWPHPLTKPTYEPEPPMTVTGHTL